VPLVSRRPGTPAKARQPVRVLQRNDSPAATHTLHDHRHQARASVAVLGPIKDARSDWRIVYRVDTDAVVIADIFAKSTRRTPDRTIADSKRRLRMYDETQ